MLGYCPIPVDLSLLDEEDEYQAMAQEVLNLSKQWQTEKEIESSNRKWLVPSQSCVEAPWQHIPCKQMYILW